MRGRAGRLDRLGVIVVFMAVGALGPASTGRSKGYFSWHELRFTGTGNVRT